jgi:glycosyltransferase involved in cell wall biosynthesis
VTNPVQLGPAGALNRALAVAQGDYVAVLDHDDLALPERLARQVAFLDAQPEVGAVGAKVRFIDEAGATIRAQSYPTDPAVARWQVLFGASLLHSASMYRRSLLQQLGGYSTKHSYSVRLRAIGAPGRDHPDHQLARRTCLLPAQRDAD